MLAESMHGICAMPTTRLAADMFGWVTICLVAPSILLGLLCIFYSIYFRSRVCNQGLIQLSYFSSPWIIRITFILVAIVWSFGEISRLSLLRGEGRVLNALNLKLQGTVCKGYIVLNLGFTEPCLLLILVFLLRATLLRMEPGILGGKWNGKTAAYILLNCFPVFSLQLILILIGPQLSKDRSSLKKLPHYFTSAAILVTQNATGQIALCTYPLLSTIFRGFFGIVLTAYLFWLGRQILKLVVNKVLRNRVYTLIFAVSSFLPLRALLLGLSVLYKPEDFLFEALPFLAFLALLFWAGLCICMLVYCPVADSLALGNLQEGKGFA